MTTKIEAYLVSFPIPEADREGVYLIISLRFIYTLFSLSVIIYTDHVNYPEGAFFVWKVGALKHIWAFYIRKVDGEEEDMQSTLIT